MATKTTSKRAGKKRAPILNPTPRKHKPSADTEAGRLEQAEADLSDATARVGEVRVELDAAMRAENEAREALRKAAEEKRDADQRDLDKQRAGEA